MQKYRVVVKYILNLEDVAYSLKIRKNFIFCGFSILLLHVVKFKA